MKPIRIQRKRTRGWKMPPNTIYVGRPTRWGNPYRPVGGDKQAAVNAYEKELLLYLSGKGCKAINVVEVRSGLEELRGKNLACWCKDGEPCHADVLLKIANAPKRGANCEAK